MKKYYLMAPGPTPVPANVLLAMAQPMIHHRTPEYEALFIEVRAGLKRLFQTAQDVIPFTASGTGSMEAAVVNTLSAGDTVLVLRAGKFGERWEEICAAYGLTVVPLIAPFGETVPADRVAQALARASRSPCGADAAQRVLDGRAARREGRRRGDAADRGDPHRRRGVEPRHRRSADGRVGRRRGRGRLAEGPDAAARAVVLRPVRQGVGPRQGLAAAEVLLRHRGRAQGGEPKNEAHFTPAVSIVVGLREVLRMLEAEGLANVFKRHERLARATRSGVEALGLELFAKASPSPALTAVVAPRGVDSEAVLAAYSASHNITIAGGQGEMKGTVFRLGHMGYVGDFDVVTALAALEQVLHELGAPVDFGAGVRAAQKVFTERG